MTKLSSNAERRGERPLEDAHRSGPEIDLGRRRFAWLTVGTASTATLMSRSAFATANHDICTTNTTSALQSFLDNPSFECPDGARHSDWIQNTRNWPDGYRPGKKFPTVSPIAPAFKGKLIRVLKKKSSPVTPPVWDNFIGLVDENSLNRYLRELKNCGRAFVTTLLNCEAFPNYPLTKDIAHLQFQEGWIVNFPPNDLIECQSQVDHCRNVLRDVRRGFERHYL